MTYRLAINGVGRIGRAFPCGVWATSALDSSIEVDER
jgi:glyceraldehyde-3-phosphate dehydrogenase/erythrose-4-phosphate dehydrogenase